MCGAAMGRPTRRPLLILANPPAGMVPLPGERRDDCARYSACLMRLARAYPQAEEGSCSTACREYAPTER